MAVKWSFTDGHTNVFEHILHIFGYRTEGTLPPHTIPKNRTPQILQRHGHMHTRRPKAPDSPRPTPPIAKPPAQRTTITTSTTSLVVADTNLACHRRRHGRAGERGANPPLGIRVRGALPSLGDERAVHGLAKVLGGAKSHEGENACDFTWHEQTEVALGAEGA